MAIQSLRRYEPRRLWDSLDMAINKDKLEGAMLACFAGCTLGAPVEFWEFHS
ncbi:ADP-ribosylglycohydrolase family protein [Paenibacillus luteus]|uniref:ADP-ribosylglycohydrolase family protein n=1 Tax=Paenibacillus luteus TaxID=2545753 RepID=UPI001143689A|nr:ADP-ribosylglycohydrolase family protein [Paenibacillus luteus]